MGGATSLTATQTAYSAGELTRDQALANATLVYQMPLADAEKLFPEDTPEQAAAKAAKVATVA